MRAAVSGAQQRREEHAAQERGRGGGGRVRRANEVARAVCGEVERFIARARWARRWDARAAVRCARR